MTCRSQQSSAVSSTSSLDPLSRSLSRPSFSSNLYLDKLCHEESDIYLDNSTMDKPTNKNTRERRLIKLAPTASSLLLSKSENNTDHLSSEYSSKPYPTILRIKPVINEVFENPSNHFLWQRMILSLIVALKVDNILEVAIEMLNKLSLRYPTMMKWFFIRLLIDAPNIKDEGTILSPNNDSRSFQSTKRKRERNNSTIYHPLQNEPRSSTDQILKKKSATISQELVSTETNNLQSLMPSKSIENINDDLEDEWGQFADFDEEPTHGTSSESAFLVDPFNSLSKFAGRRSGMNASLHKLENLAEEEEDNNEEFSEISYVRSVSSFDFPVFI